MGLAPGRLLDPILLAPSGLSGSHPLVSPVIPWCYIWTGSLSLEDRVGFTSGLRSLSGLLPLGLSLLYYGWTPLPEVYCPRTWAPRPLWPWFHPLQALGLCPQSFLSHTTVPQVTAALPSLRGLGPGVPLLPFLVVFSSSPIAATWSSTSTSKQMKNMSIHSQTKVNKSWVNITPRQWARPEYLSLLPGGTGASLQFPNKLESFLFGQSGSSHP